MSDYYTCGRTTYYGLLHYENNFNINPLTIWLFKLIDIDFLFSLFLQLSLRILYFRFQAFSDVSNYLLTCSPYFLCFTVLGVAFLLISLVCNFACQTEVLNRNGRTNRPATAAAPIWNGSARHGGAYFESFQINYISRNSFTKLAVYSRSYYSHYFFLNKIIVPNVWHIFSKIISIMWNLTWGF